jgi:hypothetical protein
MTWIRLGQEVLLERLAIAALTCAQVGAIGALVAAILPFVSEVLQIRSSRMENRRVGEWTC